MLQYFTCNPQVRHWKHRKARIIEYEQQVHIKTEVSSRTIYVIMEGNPFIWWYPLIQWHRFAADWQPASGGTNQIIVQRDAKNIWDIDVNIFTHQ